MNIGLCSQACSLCFPVVVNLTPTNSKWNCSSWNKRLLKIFNSFLGGLVKHLWMHMFEVSFTFLINNFMGFFLLYVVALPPTNKALTLVGWWGWTLPVLCHSPDGVSDPFLHLFHIIWFHFFGCGCLEMYLHFPEKKIPRITVQIKLWNNFKSWKLSSFWLSFFGYVIGTHFYTLVLRYNSVLVHEDLCSAIWIKPFPAFFILFISRGQTWVYVWVHVSVAVHNFSWFILPRAHHSASEFMLLTAQYHVLSFPKTE